MERGRIGCVHTPCGLRAWVASSYVLSCARDCKVVGSPHVHLLLGLSSRPFPLSIARRAADPHSSSLSIGGEGRGDAALSRLSRFDRPPGRRPRTTCPAGSRRLPLHPRSSAGASHFLRSRTSAYQGSRGRLA